MKLSLTWLFEHIKASTHNLNIKSFVDQFTSTIAEVDSVREVFTDLDNLSLFVVKDLSQAEVTLYSPEWRKTIYLKCENSLTPEIGQIYLIAYENKNYRWAILKDLGSNRTELLGALYVEEDKISGDWKKEFEAKDIILDVDNKAITHRPDLWGHRGMAREVAALIKSELLPEDKFLASKTIKHYDSQSTPLANNPFTLYLAKTNLDIDKRGKIKQACKRLAGVYIKQIQNKPSLLSISSRLARIDSKPINTVVDLTNYVMFDLGQPMHAFDAEKLNGFLLEATLAGDFAGQEFLLLDGQKIKLSEHDCIIKDSSGPVALAGIMGGKNSAVTNETKELFLEAANFDATTIRKTSTRIKTRTEASVRFEKSLDPNENTQALLRYLKLLSENKINFTASDNIISLGLLAKEPVIKVEQSFIWKKLGINVPSDEIEQILSSLGFGLQTEYKEKDLVFVVTVPTFRATKDIAIPEDIVEEIGRFIGYNNISPKPCIRSMIPFNTDAVFQTRAIKQHMAFSLQMNEVQNYAFYDEEFLKKMNFDPEYTISIVNPLTIYTKRLVTSLIPNLLKNIETNLHKNDLLRFFELNRVWFFNQTNLENKAQELQPVEALELAGIFYNKNRSLDFYNIKAELQTLFELLKLPVKWANFSGENRAPWYLIDQSADLYFQERRIGRAGIIDNGWMNKFLPGYAYAFELDGAFLENYKPALKEFTQLPKYQETYIDISILVDSKVGYEQIEILLSKIDSLVTDIKLIDMFHKKEWGTQRSLTVRLTLYNPQRTLIGQEIEKVKSKAEKELIKLGAKIR